MGRQAVLPCQRHLFDLPDEVAYLNCAYLSPLLKTVLQAGQQGVARKAHPWRIETDDFHLETETARGLFADLIGATADDVAVIPAASYGLANAATNLPVNPGQRLIVLEDQFPSNVQPWRQLAAHRESQLVTVQRPRSGGWTEALLQSIDASTAVVAVPHCHWTDGTLVDLPAVAARCRQVGAALVLDVTQSIGVLPFSVADIAPDFLVAAGYKWMMGPYSLGFMYAAPKYHEGQGFEHNWVMRASDPDFARMRPSPVPFPIAARRYDVGEAANFALMPMAVAALRQLLDWGVAETQATLRTITDEIAGRARDQDLLVAADDERAAHYVGVRFPDGPPEDLVARLADQNVYVSQRSDCIRVTPHLYNNENDVDRLFAALARL